MTYKKNLNLLFLSFIISSLTLRIHCNETTPENHEQNTDQSQSDDNKETVTDAGGEGEKNNEEDEKEDNYQVTIMRGMQSVREENFGVSKQNSNISHTPNHEEER